MTLTSITDASLHFHRLYCLSAAYFYTLVCSAHTKKSGIEELHFSSNTFIYPVVWLLSHQFIKLCNICPLSG